MTTRVKIEKKPQLESKIRSESREEINYFIFYDIVSLMEHDSYRRVKGRIRQKSWAEYK